MGEVWLEASLGASAVRACGGAPNGGGVLLLASFNSPGELCRLAGGSCGWAAWLYGAFVNKPAGVVLAMLVMALPVTYAVFDGALRKSRTEAYFRSLGLRGLSLIWAMLLSLRRAAVSALILSFLRGFGELGALLIFASYPPTVPIYIYNSWLIYGVGPAASAAILVIAASAVAAYLLKIWLYK